MPVPAAALARPAQRDAVQQRALVANFGGFAHHDARAVVEHDALANRRGRVQVQRKHLRVSAGVRVRGGGAGSQNRTLNREDKSAVECGRARSKSLN